MAEQRVQVAQHRHAGHGVRRAAQPVVKDTQDVQVATLQGLGDQAFGMFGGADDGDGGRQAPVGSPPADGPEPQQVKPADHDGAQRGPFHQRPKRGDMAARDSQHGPGGRAQAEGREDPAEVQPQAVAPAEPVEAHRAQQGERRDGGQDDRRDLPRRRRQRRPVRDDQQGGGQANQAQHIQGAEIVGRKPFGLSRSAVDQLPGPEGAAPVTGIGLGHRLGGQGLQASRIQPALQRRLTGLQGARGR